MPTAILIHLVLGKIHGGCDRDRVRPRSASSARSLRGDEGKLTCRMLNASAEATARNTAHDRRPSVRRPCAQFRLRPPRRAAGSSPSSSPRCRYRPGAPCCRSPHFTSRSAPSWKASRWWSPPSRLVHPVELALGYYLIWFGVIVTMLVEIALISPPDGTVLYVLQGMRKDGGPITDMFSGVMPFVLV